MPGRGPIWDYTPMEQVTDEIFMVGGGSLSHPNDACVYLIREKDRGVLVDAGCGPSVDRILSHARSAGVLPEKIQRLLLTHCHFDHTGGAAKIRDLCGCTIFAHEKDVAFLEAGDQEATAASWYNARLPPFDVDEKMTGEKMDIPFGDRIITALHTPGHSPAPWCSCSHPAAGRCSLARMSTGPWTLPCIPTQPNTGPPC